MKKHVGFNISLHEYKDSFGDGGLWDVSGWDLGGSPPPTTQIPKDPHKYAG